MNPTLSKRLNMTLDGEIRVTLNLTVGDWTNDNDANTFEDLAENLGLIS